MRVLAIDVGGTNVKIHATGQKVPRKFPSGPKMTPSQMVAGVKELAKDWEYDVVSVGFPAPVKKDRITREPHNLGPGWIGFNFKAAFNRPVKVINDAAMQALGSCKTGTMLFLGARYGARLGADHTWAHRAPGTGPTPLSKGNCRRLPRSSRAQAIG